MKKSKFLVAGFVLFIGLGFLGYRGLASSSAYYLTVSELNQKVVSLSPGERVKVDGMVSPASVKTTLDTRGQVLQFTLVDAKDSQSTLNVIYRGAVPDTFKPDSEVVVEGVYTSAGVFQADNLSTKCASKYIPGS